MFILKNILDKYTQKNGKTNKLFTCFEDLKKAFDTVLHAGLFVKLQKAEMNGESIVYLNQCSMDLFRMLNV